MLSNVDLNPGSSLPTQIGKLVALSELHLTGLGLAGTLVSQIGLMQALHTLVLDNNDLQGTVPLEWANARFTRLSLRNNPLTGRLPLIATNW